jgi:hypothetical protein
MLTVCFEDPQVAAAMAAVEPFMEHCDMHLAIIVAPEHLYSQAASTDLLRRHIDGLVAA